MGSFKDQGYLVCSPEEIALLKKHHFSDWAMGLDGLIIVGEGREELIMASAEIKTIIASSFVASYAALLSPDLIFCDVCDEMFNKYVPIEHRGQLFHHLTVSCLSLAFYVCMAETDFISMF